MVRVPIALELSLFDIFRNDVVVQLSGDDRLKGLCMSDKSTHYISINRLMISLVHVWRMEVLVDTGYMFCQCNILILILSVQE